MRFCVFGSTAHDDGSGHGYVSYFLVVFTCEGRFLGFSDIVQQEMMGVDVFFEGESFSLFVLDLNDAIEECYVCGEIGVGFELVACSSAVHGGRISEFGSTLLVIAKSVHTYTC